MFANNTRIKPAINLSNSALIFVVISFLTIVGNQTFFSLLDERLDFSTLAAMGYFVTFFVLMNFIVILPVTLIGISRLLKPILLSLVVLTAVLSYFNTKLGVLFDKEMIRNIYDTIKENNHKEAKELLSPALVWHVLQFSALPVLLIAFNRNADSIKGDYLVRLKAVGGLSLLLFILILLNFKYLSFFSRENRDLRVWLNPIFPLVSTQQLIKSKLIEDDTMTIIGPDAVQRKITKTRTIGLFVVGETARADHFSLNGYQGETNPELKEETITNFSNTQACGTSTAYSVPCMFSFYNKDDYSPSKANQQSNVLDILESTGIKTVWIDNNSSCKGVCKRIENKNIFDHPDKNSDFFNDGELYDEQLINELDHYIFSTDKDILIVLHTMGSHGPAYHRRYPSSAAHFKPYCQNDSPHTCSDLEVKNAYDNTIVYTDLVLTKLIHKLKGYADAETFMYYASDHGESLGENGIYLHGLPYILAPRAQKHVPMMLWLSPQYIASRGESPQAILKDYQQTSHDNISHTLLDLYSVKSEILNKALSLVR